MIEKLKKIMSCIFVFLAYRICLSNWGKLNATVFDLNQQQRARSIYKLHRFCRGENNTMLIKITGESVKFIGRELCKYELTALHIITE